MSTRVIWLPCLLRQVCAVLLACLLSGCGGSGIGGNVFHASTGSMDDGLTSGSLFGRVTDVSNGAGMADVKLDLARTGATSSTRGAAAKTAEDSVPSTTISIDPDGNYQSPNLLAGTYRLSASRVGFNSYTGEVSVGGGQRVQKDLALTVSDGSTGFRGVLRDAGQKPVSGATITVTLSSGAKPRQASASASSVTTNADGWYAMTGMEAGTYSVVISHPSFSRKRLSITVKAGQLQQFDLVMQPGNPANEAGVSGFVRDSKGRPIEGANVSLDYEILRGKSKTSADVKSASAIVGLVRTDSTGYYAFLDVTPGTYVVKAEHPDYLANSAKVTAIAGQDVTQDIILHWRLAFNGAADYFLGVWGSSPKSVYAVGALGVIKHYDGQVHDNKQWVYQRSSTGENLFTIWGTADERVVLAVGNGNTVTRSTDHGATWTTVGAGVGASCHAVWGTADGSVVYLISPFGQVYKSTDLGLTWTAGTYTKEPQPSPRDSSDLNHIAGQADGRYIYISGRNGVIYRSQDFGATWSALQTGVSDSFKFVHCWADGTGHRHVVASGDRTRATVRSDDDGATWTRADLPAIDPNRPFEQRGMSGLADGSAIYVVTSQYVARSGDGGATWTKVGDGDVLDFCIWATADPDRGETAFMGAAEGRIWRSTKAGAIWEITNEGDIWTLLSVYALTATEICAVGNFNPSSALLGMYTAGLHGAPPYLPSKVNVAALALRSIWGSPEHLYVAAADKGICLSEDRGATWRTYLAADKFYLTGLSGGATWADLVAVGYDIEDHEKGLFSFHASNGKWQSVRTEAGVHLRAVTLVPGRNRYVAVGEKGQVWLFDAPPADLTSYRPTRADSGGATDTLYAVWASPSEPFLCAVGAGGLLLTSSDGGASWARASLGGADLYGVWGTSAEDLFVVGYENYRYDGKSWLKMTAQNEGTVQTDKFYSVGVSGSPDARSIYAVGLGGRVYVVER